MLTDLGLTILFGTIMGLLSHAKRNKTIKKPRNLKNTFFPGYLTDVGYGIAGALITVLMAEPTEIGRLIILSIIGGHAGETAVLNANASNQQKNQEALKKVNDQENEKLPSPPKIMSDEKQKDM